MDQEQIFNPLNVAMPVEVLEAFDRHLAAIREDWADHPLSEWLISQAVEYRALPLLLDMGAVISLRRDGVFLIDEGTGDPAKPLDDFFWRDIALIEGGKRYPAFLALLPSRTLGAVTCRRCAGTGRRIDSPGWSCFCGGRGWIPEYWPAKLNGSVDLRGEPAVYVSN